VRPLHGNTMQPLPFHSQWQHLDTAGLS